MIRPEDRFERSPEVIDRKMKDELVLLPIRSKQETKRQFYFVEEVGGRIWELVDGHHACQKILETIASEFGVSEVKIKEDIFTFLKDLAKEGLIRRSS